MTGRGLEQENVRPTVLGPEEFDDPERIQVGRRRVGFHLGAKFVETQHSGTRIKCSISVPIASSS